MKANKLILVPALALVLALVSAPGAEAGLFGKKKAAQSDRTAKSWRYDNMPTMSFHAGRISQDIYSGWNIDDVKVQLAPQCKVVGSDGEAADLYAGRDVIIMGPRVGKTIIAWQVRVMPRDIGGKVRDSAAEIEWSQADPTVGMGTAPQ